MEGTYPIDLGVEVDNGFSTRPAIVCTYRARPDPVVRASGASGCGHLGKIVNTLSSSEAIGETHQVYERGYVLGRRWCDPG
jgi:hypothetical protein